MEKWEKVKGIIGNYEVSNIGRVKSHQRGYPFILKKSTNRGGYHHVILTGKIFKVHRLVMMHFSDDFKDELYVDHINGDRKDNRLENLRMVTCRENLIGRRKTRGTSKYRGVFWDKAKKKWKASAPVKYLGLFDNEKEAALAWNRAAKLLGYRDEAMNDVGDVDA